MNYYLRQIDRLIVFVRKFPLLGKVPVNFYRFFTVGVTTFILDFITLHLFQYPLGVSGRWDIWQFSETFTLSFSHANMISVVLGSILGYYLNKTWSFEDSRDNVASQYSKYLTVAIINSILNNIFYGLLHYEVFLPAGWTDLLSSSVSKFLSTSFQVITSYLFYKFIIFRTDEEVLSEATIT